VDLKCWFSWTELDTIPVQWRASVAAESKRPVLKRNSPVLNTAQ
jgi:hypothetical protein